MVHLSFHINPALKMEDRVWFLVIYYLNSLILSPYSLHIHDLHRALVGSVSVHHSFVLINLSLSSTRYNNLTLEKVSGRLVRDP